MTIPSATPDVGARLVRLGLLWLQRVAGLALFAVGVAYWIRLVGVFPGPNWRFDLMSLEWQVAALVLAVLAPVAGVGLWLAASWGIVVWVLVVAVEIVMHTVLSPVFGGIDVEVALLAAGVGVFVMLRLAKWWLRLRTDAQG